MLISNLYASHYLFNHPCSKYYCRYDVYTNLYDYTGNHLIYNIVYFTEGKSYFETAHMSSKPEKLLIYCDTHTFNICNRLTVAVFIVNNA